MTNDLFALLKKAGRKAATQRGAPRHEVKEEGWRGLAERLGKKGSGEKGLDLMGLWADQGRVLMALFQPETGQFGLASIKVVDGAFPSVGALHPPAIRPERMIRDLFGYDPVGLEDQRNWIDHSTWHQSMPLSPQPAAPSQPAPYPFLASRGEGLHQIPVGPVHAGIIEPGHFRFTCAGETVVRLEERLGYVHKGIEKLAQGKTPLEAAPICARISGDSTVAFSLAFSRAVEEALDLDIPQRAHWLRALMGELERLANHFGDIGAICNDAAFAFIHAHFGILREDVLQAAQTCFGHRLMMDRVIPGGTACDLDSGGRAVLLALLDGLEERLPALIELYDSTPSIQDRTRTSGRLDPGLAHAFAAGGFVGRASGRSFDARAAFAYPPFDRIALEPACAENGDVDARVWVRIREAEQSMILIRRILADMPDGECRIDLPAPGNRVREGIALVEGFRGDVLVWVRLDRKGRIARLHPRDPSVFQWPLLEDVIRGNIVADFPLCNKSFNCSYSGHDL